MEHTKENFMRKKSRNDYHGARRAKVEGLLLLVLTLTAALVNAPAARAQKSATAEGKSHYTRLDGARIHYQSYGKGREAIVLIHGWTFNLDNWRDQVPDLAKHLR